MAKWKLFGKSKSKKENKLEHDEIIHPASEEILESEDATNIEHGHDVKESTMKEYHETLYSQEHTPKKYEEPHIQKSWESLNTIEKNVNISISFYFGTGVAFWFW